MRFLKVRYLKVKLGLKIPGSSFLFLAMILPCLFAGIRQDKTDSPAKNPSVLLNIVPSQLSYKVYSLGMRRQDLTGTIIAVIGNARIAREGVDYQFDLQGLIQEHGLKPLAGSDLEIAPFRLPMKTVDGEPVRLDVEVSAPGMCGERLAVIPLSGLTATELDVVVKEKQYRLRRPRSFILESMSLVDEALKKRLRTWELPFVTEPSGISTDGRVLYFKAGNNIYSGDLRADVDLWPELPALVPNASRKASELLLAVSEGIYRFVDAAEVPTGEKSESMENPPSDPKDAYVMYKRFQIGGKKFIVRFDGPCT